MRFTYLQTDGSYSRSIDAICDMIACRSNTQRKTSWRWSADVTSQLRRQTAHVLEEVIWRAKSPLNAEINLQKMAPFKRERSVGKLLSYNLLNVLTCTSLPNVYTNKLKFHGNRHIKRRC